MKNSKDKQNWHHLHLPFFDVGRLSIATEETLVVQPQQARDRAQQQLQADRHIFFSQHDMYT